MGDLEKLLTQLTAVPIWVFVVLCLTLGLAPFSPEPHLVEKIRMLAGGTLTRGIDIFDLVLHGLPFLLLAVRLLASMRWGERP